MLRTSTRVQPTGGTMAGLLHEALADGAYQRLDAAVAYVSTSGIVALQKGRESLFDGVTARWLSSLDWCRSEPVALQALDRQAGSAVRVFQGDTVVEQQGCAPALPFHPKGFLFSGADARLLVSGSGNLSRNGLTRGVEMNTVLEVRDPRTAEERAGWDALGRIADWFDDTWAGSPPYGPLHDRYSDRHAAAGTTMPLTDDDVAPRLPGRQGFSAADLVVVRRASTFWIDAGNLTPNLGQGNPGSQLMTKALTRVFFGFPADPLAKQTGIGSVDMRYAGVVTPDLPMEYAHNGMDRVNLPHPGSGGPAGYDRETLVFTKAVQDGRLVYDLRLATPAGRRALARTGTQFRMTGRGRAFGFVA